VPVGNISQFNVAGGLTEWGNFYYQTNSFTRSDTTDKTYFDYWYAQANYKLNTLNRKMYPTEGTLINARARLLEGTEIFEPGNTSPDTARFRRTHPAWLQLKLTFDSYIKTFKGFKLGVFGEGVYSTQEFFNNYQATILSAPAFNPIPESQTFFIDAFRAHNYFAGGLKAITTPVKGLDIRLEAYIFQPVFAILEDKNGKAVYSSPFLYRHVIGMATAVYNTAVGPVSFGVNYYDQYQNSLSFFFHFGYIIFNRKSID
jgi:NTE family protein